MARPGAPAFAPRPALENGIADIPASLPSDPSASGCGPARGTAPGLPRVIARAAHNLVVDEEMLRYAERRAGNALRRFCAVIRTVDILLGRRTAGETTCRLHVTLAGGASISVGHSGPAILHAIDTAVETAAHIVSTRTAPLP